VKIQSSRFGELEVAEETLITLPLGMVGFPDDTTFAWIAHRNSNDIVWLQSAHTKELAFPLVNAVTIAAGYPDVPVEEMAEQVGLEFEDPNCLALMVVLSASTQGGPIVNLMAPVVINSQSRQGSQVVLTNSRFTTAQLPPPQRTQTTSSREVG
jgi:flagellar assembly factor FliW